MQPLRTLLDGLAGRAGSKRAAELRLIGHWPELVGSYVAERSRPRLEGARLRVEVEDARVGEALRGLEPLVAPKLEALLGVTPEIVIQVARLRRYRPPHAEPAAPAGPAAPLGAALEAAVQGIADLELRASFERVAGRYLEGARRRGGSER